MSQGFTLLEILIAIVLFTMGVVAVAGILGSGLVSESDAENTTIAINLGQRKMEEIRNLAFVNIDNEAKTAVDDFPAFQREVAVTEPETNLKQVMVTVYWTFKGDEISVPLQTYISKN